VDDHVDVGQVVQIFQQVTRYDQYLGDLAHFECSPFVFNAKKKAAFWVAA
jgi:hypothetical protein